MLDGLIKEPTATDMSNSNILQTCEEAVDAIEHDAFPISREDLLKMLQNVQDWRFHQSDPHNEALDRLGAEGLADLVEGKDGINRWKRTEFGSLMLSYLLRK